MDQTWDRQQLGRAASADPDVRNALSTIRRRAKRLSALEQKPVSRRSRSSAGRQPSTRRSAERQPSARSGAGRQPSMQSTMHAEMSFGEVTEREAGTLALRSSAPAARPYDKPKGQAPRRSAAGAAPGKAGVPWKSTENEDLLAFVCHRCNACTAYHNGVSEICGTSLKNCPWVIAKSRAVRQVNAHFAGHEKAEPEPSARRESNYALLCRSGFLGAEPIKGTGLPPPTERTPRTVNVTHQRGTYIVPHKDWNHWNKLIEQVPDERSRDNVYKVGDTFMQKELDAQYSYVDDLRWKLADETTHGNPYAQENQVLPWKACTQVKPTPSHLLDSRKRRFAGRANSGGSERMAGQGALAARPR